MSEQSEQNKRQIDALVRSMKRYIEGASKDILNLHKRVKRLEDSE